MASTSHDGESAYMLRLIQTSVPIRWLNRNECGSRKNHNYMQTRGADKESVFHNSSSNGDVTWNHSGDTAYSLF